MEVVKSIYLYKNYKKEPLENCSKGLVPLAVGFVVVFMNEKLRQEEVIANIRSLIENRR